MSEASPGAWASAKIIAEYLEDISILPPVNLQPNYIARIIDRETGAEKLLEDYERLVVKFDATRGALARAVEHLGGKVNPPDDIQYEWFDWLILEADRAIAEVEKK